MGEVKCTEMLHHKISSLVRGIFLMLGVGHYKPLKLGIEQITFCDFILDK